MKKMKKLSAITAAMVLSISAMSLTAFADETAKAAETAESTETTQTETAAPETINVYVTIANGDLKLANEAVPVNDHDSDGILTINDALYAAHDAYYEGGAAAGYASSMTDYGLSLSKLWGVENGGSYGYYVNNASAWSLTDTVKDGDFVNAFVYTDTTAWSDAYSFFDKSFAEIDLDNDETLELTLSYVGYDADWNPVNLPAKGAYITLNGEKTEFVTDDEGKVTVTLDEGGDYVVSAVSDTQNLVPPVLKLSALKSDEPVTEPEDGDTEQGNTEEGEETGSTETDGEETKGADNGKNDTQNTQGTATSNPKTGSSSAVLGLVSLAAAGALASKRRR